MKRNLSHIVLTLTALLALSAQSLPLEASESSCFSVVVGRNASVDGYVVMAHNEDDSPPQVVNHHKIDRIKHVPGDRVILRNGGELEQVGQTWAYIWVEMPEMDFSDSYVNEWGVSIASNSCPSREDAPKITDGGIGYMLRRLVAERSKTAREAVVLAGSLVERFGYTGSGRTYVICDPDEGWLFCAVNGNHWLASRVPDDEVAIIANTYTVREVDLSDDDRCLASPDIVEYAVSKGWYDAASGQPFDFAAAYSNPKVASDSAYFCRQWAGQRLISGIMPAPGEKLPFSVVPESKLDVAMVMRIMRDHYENTELYESSSPSGNPHDAGTRAICHRTTQTSFVVQLRRDLPLDIGIVYCVSLGYPCASPFIPFHFGIPRFPDGLSTRYDRPSEDFYRDALECPFKANPQDAFWTFKNFQHKIGGRYGTVIKDLRRDIETLERTTFAAQETVDSSALELYETDRDAAMELLSNFSKGIYLSAMEVIGRAMSGI